MVFSGIQKDMRARINVSSWSRVAKALFYYV